jgi:transposase
MADDHVWGGELIHVVGGGRKLGSALPAEALRPRAEDWLSPHHEISGGKILRNHTLPTDNRAGQAFRQAAACVIRSDSVFGAFYRRKKTQLGPMQALVATAHKIARAVYHLLKYKIPYQDSGAEAYEQKYKERELAHLRKKAAKLGYTLAATEV